jgi:two-component system chemotaxis response regulator CheY
MKRALVVDDSRAMRTIIGKILQQLGFEVSQASHGKEAIDLLRRAGAVELATVDWNMPEMCGLDFVTEVRRDPSFDGMRMVMVTTESELAHVERALAAGANEYVMKPFTAEVMREKLQLIGVESA